MIWLLLIGFVFAILSPSVYASFPLIVDEGALGTAYGFVSLAFHFGLLVYPLVIGALMTKYHMWMYVHFFFAGTNTLGFLACVLIYCTDKQNIFIVPVSQIKKGYEIIGDSEHELSEQ